MRQPEVQDHQVGALVGALEGGRPVAADVDVVPLTAQGSGEWLGDRGVILGQQDTGHGRIVDRAARSPTGPRRGTPLGEGRDALLAVRRERRGRASSRPPPRAPWPGRRRPRARIARLACRSPTGEFAAIWTAISSARSRAPPAGTTSSTTPSAPASAAGIRRAVKIIAAARRQPTRRVSSCVPPPPGMTPTDTSGSPTTAASPAIDEVAGQRDLQTAAEGEALHAASEGIGRFSTPPYAARATGRCCIRSASLKLLRSFRSAPTQNALGLVLVSDHAAHALVRGEVGTGGAEVPRHGRRHGVHGLGPVQRQLGDVPAVAVSRDGDQGSAVDAAHASPSSTVGSSSP